MSEPQRKEELPGPFAPSAAELPSEDGETLETARHRDAMTLLIDSLNDHWADRDDFYVGGDMFFYFSPTQARHNDFRGPDVFVALGVQRRDRLSWVVWEEGGRVPDVVIELTSQSTRHVDFGRKKHIYAAVGVPTYVLFDPFTAALEFNVLKGGEYIPTLPNAGGRYPVEGMGLELGTWDGVYVFPAVWLRWFEPDGAVVPTGAERATRANAEAAEANAEAAEAKTEAAEAKTEAAEAKTEAAEAKAQAARAESRASDLAARLAAYERRFGSVDEED